MKVHQQAPKDSASRSVCSVRWNKSTETMQANFFNFLQNKSLCDVVLRAEGKEIQAHRIVLASTSLYFQKLFLSSRLTATERVDVEEKINIPHTSFMNLCLIVKYAYTGEVSMAENRVESFLRAANKFDMHGLRGNYEIVNVPKATKRKMKKKKKRSDKKGGTKSVSKKRPLEDDSIPTSSNSKKIKLKEDDDDVVGKLSEACDLSRKRRNKNESEETQNQQPIKRVCVEHTPTLQCRYCLSEFATGETTKLQQHEAFCAESSGTEYSDFDDGDYDDGADYDDNAELDDW